MDTATTSDRDACLRVLTMLRQIAELECDAWKFKIGKANCSLKKSAGRVCCIEDTDPVSTDDR